MANVPLKQRNGPAVDPSAIEAFKQQFRGQVLSPGEAGYDHARHIWNASVDKHPGLIARCSDATDVVRAVKFARTNNVLVAVKAGGHNVAGHALCDDGIVIDLSAMKAVSVDPKARTVRVQGGSATGRHRS
jgi:FAD/FMN-containing dehydrogenase